ncbi:release factor [Fomitiporia mediterranea MF3/22]|uniref:release factor n=1 Tax=Fomitiporia mediterranea (strain MF3/22) TaxID=694068 RepID=UPI0004408F14|nr:release factor [Fomitiporia mediterranea MF3/22]EJD08523.1 release factor [Fomitiporia mediterranea MF3/22]
MLAAWLRPRRPCLRQLHLSIPRTPRISRLFSTLEAVDKDNARLLAIVEKRITERNSLAAKINTLDPASLDIEQNRRLKSLDGFYETWSKWQETRNSLVETATLLRDDDPTIRELAEEEYEALLKKYNDFLHDKFPALLIPHSQTSDMSALLEIKPGVGGSESSLFLADLLRMYSRFANLRGWSSKIVAQEDREGGGMKNAILEVDGEGAYDCLRWESGVHRVQRVPKTEAAGRVHTSTVQVIVLPTSDETSDSQVAGDLFDQKDIKIEVMRARGAGGQHVNKTESAVRLTHIPTGITVSMQDERSQHMNKSRAFQVLRARLLDRKLQAEIAERRDTRRQLVRSADRSEKIRTYNFAQDRVTDHRIGLTLKNLVSVLDGEGLQTILDALQADYYQSLVEDVLENE